MEVKGDVDDHLLSVNTKSDLQGCARWADFLRCYALLGFISFGGPQSHMAVLKDQVERRFWLSKESFGELYSLCSAIPGPSSSQLATAVGVARMGWTGGLIGYLLFLLPGFTMMMILGSLAGHYFADGFQPPFYLSALELGLSCAALVLIGSNAMSLGKSLCTHRVTQLICLAASVLTLLFQQYWYVFPSVFAASALVSFVFFSIRPAELPDVSGKMPVDFVAYSKWIGGSTLLVSVSTLVVLIVLSNLYPTKELLAVAEIFFRIGFSVFGGGNVILAMFLTELVPMYISHSQLLVGFALVGLLPGPVFNFSLFIGAAIGGPFVALLCWFCLNFPGIALVYALFPFWQSIRTAPWWRKLIAGLNACGVALIIQAYIAVVFAIVGTSPYRAVLHVVSFGLFLIFDLKPHFLILLGGATGILYGTCLHYLQIPL